jgi:hypothetical protein
MRKLGYWKMQDGFYPDCYLYFKNQQVHFHGIIAARKVLRNTIAILYIGIAPQRYVTVRIKKWYGKAKTVSIRGYGTGNSEIIDCIHYTLL